MLPAAVTALPSSRTARESSLRSPRRPSRHRLRGDGAPAPRRCRRPSRTSGRRRRRLHRRDHTAGRGEVDPPGAVPVQREPRKAARSGAPRPLACHRYRLGPAVPQPGGPRSLEEQAVRRHHASRSRRSVRVEAERGAFVPSARTARPTLESSYTAPRPNPMGSAGWAARVIEPAPPVWSPQRRRCQRPTPRRAQPARRPGPRLASATGTPAFVQTVRHRREHVLLHAARQLGGPEAPPEDAPRAPGAAPHRPSSSRPPARLPGTASQWTPEGRGAPVSYRPRLRSGRAREAVCECS